MWWFKKKRALQDASRVERDIRKDITLSEIRHTHAAFEKEVLELERIVREKKGKRRVTRHRASP